LQEVTGVTTTAYQYDRNGNRISKDAGSNTSAYDYDFNDRLVAFHAGIHAATYTLDAFGRRASRTVDGTIVQYAYDGLDGIDEYDSQGTRTAQNLFGLGTDENLAKLSGGQNFYYLQDGANSVSAIVDATQTVQNHYEYDAWGNILSKAENVANRYTFASRELE
jgi:YD repeat-containing protein